MLRKDPLSELLLCMIMGYDTLEIIVLHTSPRQYIPALVVLRLFAEYETHRPRRPDGIRTGAPGP